MSISLREYNKIHKWNLRHWKKTGVCEDCGKVVKTHWANLSQEYKRERSDWKELCASCHRKYDFSGDDLISPPEHPAWADKSLESS